MKIFELEEKTEVNLIILFGEKTLNFKSTYVGAKGKEALVSAVRVDGKVLNLEGDDIKVSLMVERENDKPIIWTDCDVKMIVVKGNVLLKISSKSDAKSVNRRDGFRLFIGGNAKGRIGRNKEVLQMVLKDVSYSGFAVIIDSKTEYEKDMPIRVVYKDEELKVVLDLIGKIVRVEARSDRRLLGCKLDLPNPVLGKYIGDKQQKILASRNGNDTVNKK